MTLTKKVNIKYHPNCKRYNIVENIDPSPIEIPKPPPIKNIKIKGVINVTTKNNVKYKNDGERLYDFTQKVFTLLSEIGKERKQSKEDWNNEKITRKQHHQNITNLYVKAVVGMNVILISEFTTIIKDDVIAIFKEKEKVFFDNLTLLKNRQLANKVKPIIEQVKLEKKEIKNGKANVCTHKAFAGLKDFKVS